MELLVVLANTPVTDVDWERVAANVLLLWLLIAVLRSFLKDGNPPTAH